MKNQMRDVLGHYTLPGATQAHTETEILQAAEDILERRLHRMGTISNPSDMQDFLRMRLAGLDHEEFHAVWLDQRHQILHTEMLTRGTLSGASVYPREVVKAALRANAAAVVFSHCHPSGISTASQADKLITKELTAALALVEVRVLDHIIVTAGQCTSFAAMGLL